MTRRKITLTNNFHHTSVTLRARRSPRGMVLSRRQVLRARRELCGCEGCTCGGPLGERGNQSVEVRAYPVEDGSGDVLL